MKDCMPLTERPKSKMLFFGADALTNAELLSLVIQTGAKEKTAVDLARDTLSYVYDNGRDLGTAEVRELAEVYGIGETKACSIVAAMELGKRLATDRALKRLEHVRDSDQVANLLMSQFGDKKKEHFVALYLNTRLKVESQEIVSVGSLDSAPVHPREVFGPAIRRGAAAVLVAHQHPTGDPSPSEEDIRLTKRLINAADILGIRLLDHLILGDGRFVSLKAEGYFDN